MKKRIGVVSIYNPKTDKKAHSGILYKINEAVEKAGYETVWIENKISFWYKWCARLCSVINHLLPKNIYFDRTFIGCHLLASTIDKRAIENVDYLLAIHYFHVPYCLGKHKPVIYHSDATFDLANNYYLHNIWKWNERQAEQIEQVALRNSVCHLSSSEWRRNSIINHYGINSEYNYVLEYGPCVDLSDIVKQVNTDGYLHMLFIGVEWQRKGGDIAVRTCNELNKRGIKSKIYIVGIKNIPNICKNNENIIFVGYLNKNNVEEYKHLKDILSHTDIMILPTKAECSGIVFCESSAYGNPIITYDTGGVPNYVINGLNGYRLPLSGDSYEFADKIQNMIVKNELASLSKGGLEYANKKLNWDNWTVVLKELKNANYSI